MNPTLFIVLLLMIVIIGILVFNYKLGLNNMNVAYIIGGIAFGCIILLMLTYNAHPECDALINHNNITLQQLQEKCYQYIDI
jgi:hypothetical protein